MCIRDRYKGAFFLTAFGQFLTSFTAFFGGYFLLHRFHRVEEFSYPQVLLYFSVVLFSFSLAECFARGFDSFPTMIGNGEFDRILVRPRSLVFQVLASKMESSRIGRLIQAALLLALALPGYGVAWTAPCAGVLILTIISKSEVSTKNLLSLSTVTLQRILPDTLISVLTMKRADT